MRTSAYLRLLAAGWLSVLVLFASEQRGIVTFGGLPVPGVAVTATRDEKKVTTITDGMGEYSFPDLADGVWNMQVDMSGFTPLKQDVTVAPSATASTWEMKLKPLSEMQAEVQATALTPRPVAAAPAKPSPAKPAPAKPAAQTAAAGRGVPPAPAAAATQAAAAPADAPALAPPAPAAINSQAADGFLVNGSSVNGGASPFALNPAFGNNRRGPRSLYTYSLTLSGISISPLNARPFSQNGEPTFKPQNSSYTIGGSVQGPIRIPHILRNGPTFAINFTVGHGRNPSTTPALLPTPAQREGDLSNFTGPIMNPLTGIPFAGNIIPPSQISPQATALLALYPKPNFTSSQFNYELPLVSATNSENFSGRLSKQLGRKGSITINFGGSSSRGSTPNLFGFLDTSSSLGLNISPTYNRQWTNRLSTQFSYSFSRSAPHNYSNFENKINISGNAGITGNLQSPAYWGPPALTFATTGIYGLTDGSPTFNRSQSTIFGAPSTWNHGRHTVKFGADYRRQDTNNFSQNNARGTFGFTGQATAVPGVVGSGSDLADFLLGIPDNSTIAYGNADKYLRATTYDALINDDWRVNSALTLNYGLRWDYSAPITELYGRLVNLDVTPGFTAAAPVLGTNPVGSVTGQTYPSSLMRPDWHTFQPSLGLAWRPISGSSMVVRAGYGLRYATSVFQTFVGQMDQQSPLSKSFTVANSPADPLTLANGFVPSPSTLTTNFGIDPNFKVGYAQTWNISIQKDLPAGMQMVVNYTGIKGTRMTQTIDPNTFPAGGVNPCPSCPIGFSYVVSNGDSTRQAGYIQVRRRLHNGFTAQVLYTYAKAIDDVPAGAAQNWRDFGAERALSNFDQRQNAQLQLQYTSGMGIGGGTFITGWKAAVLKEWTFLAPITWGTGLPESPNYNADLGGSGFSGPLRPNFTGASLYAAPAGLALNPLAFGQPLPGQFGNAGRNTITGPDQFSLNASMARSFRINDRTSMTLTVASTNTLNHPVPGSYGVTYGSPTLGLPIFPTSGMRSMVTTARFTF